MSLNKEISLTGTVGRIEGQYTPSGKMVCKFSLAVQVGYGDNKTTEWYEVVAWEKVADLFNEHVGKGSKVQVRGDFKLQTWIAKKGQSAGEAQAKIEVTVRDFQFIHLKKEEVEHTDEEEPEFMQD